MRLQQTLFVLAPQDTLTVDEGILATFYFLIPPESQLQEFSLLS